MPVSKNLADEPGSAYEMIQRMKGTAATPNTLLTNVNLLENEKGSIQDGAPPIHVEVAGKGTLEFPAGTDPKVIDMVVKRDFFSGDGAAEAVNQRPEAHGVPKDLMDKVQADLKAGAAPQDIVHSIVNGTKYPDLAAKMKADLTAGLSHDDVFQRLMNSKINFPVISPHGEGLVSAPTATLNRDAEVAQFLPTVAREAGNVAKMAYTGTAAAFNQGFAGIMGTLDKTASDISAATGLPKGGLMEKAAQEYSQNAEYWSKKFSETGPDAVAEFIARFMGGLAPGVVGWEMNVPFAAKQGWDEAEARGENPWSGAAKAAIDRLVTGGMFKAVAPLSRPVRAATLGTAFGAKAAIDGGPVPEEIATGVGLGLMGGPGQVRAIDIIESMKAGRRPEARPAELPPAPEKVRSAAENGTKEGTIGTEAKETPPGVKTAGESTSTGMGGGVQLKNPVDLRAEQFGAGLQSRGVAPDSPQYRQAVEEVRSHLDQVTDRTGFWPSSHRSSILKNALTEHQRTGGDIAYANIDLRNLGALNKQRGSNSAADRDIRAVADILRQAFRDAGREEALFVEASKGDEFDILLPNATRAQLDNILDQAKIKIGEYARREGLDALQPVKPGNAPGFGIYSGSAEFKGHENIGSIIEQADTETAADKIRLFDEFERRKINESGSQTGAIGPLTPGREARRPQEGAAAQIAGPGGQEAGEHPAAPRNTRPEEVTPPRAAPTAEPPYIPEGVKPSEVQAGIREQGLLPGTGAPESSEALPKSHAQGVLPGQEALETTLAKPNTQEPPALRKATVEGLLPHKGAPETPQGDIAAGGIAFGQKLPKYAAGNTSINLERIDADYPVKYLINQVAEQFKGKIDNARRGKITHEETRKLAEDLGLTEESLLFRRKGQAFNAEEATAARDILNTSAQQLVELQRQAVESGSDAALVNFRLALSRHAAIQAEVSGAAAEAGRALSAHRILSKSIPHAERNQKAMLDALGGREITEEIARSFSRVDISNVAEVNRFIRAFSKVKASDMIYEAWINFLLSGPKTHIVNAVSNTLTFFTKAPESAISSGGDMVLAKIGKRPRERFLGEVGADFVGARAGLIDGARAALKSFREEMPEDALLKLEQAKYKAIPGKVGEVVRLPGRFLTAADEFYKSVNYASELYALAYRKAAKEGATGGSLSEKAAEYVQNPSTEMIDAAKNEAQYRTFTQPYGKWSRVLERSRQIPGVRYLVPFMRTPTNIAKFALERTPMNFARILYKAKKGEIIGSQISDELAKPILGSMIGAAVVVLAQDGLITGGGPKNKNDRDALYRSGWQPYSLKIGDRYFSYGRLEPVGSVFGMAADYSELIKDTEDKELVDYAENIALSISKNLTSKTFMKGVSSALDAISDPRRYGESWIESLAGSAVPSIMNTAAKMTDETVREVHGPGEAVQSRIPYLSKDLLPKRDLWGREVQITGNALERGFSPVVARKESDDPADKELLRLGMTPGMPKPEHKGEKLTPIKYDAFLWQSGKLAHENALGVIKNPRYAELDDEGKIHILTQVIEDARDETKAELFGRGTVDDIIDSRTKARKRRAEIWSFPETREGAMLRKLKRIREE